MTAKTAINEDHASEATWFANLREVASPCPAVQSVWLLVFCHFVIYGFSVLYACPRGFIVRGSLNLRGGSVRPSAGDSAFEQPAAIFEKDPSIASFEETGRRLMVALEDLYWHLCAPQNVHP
jgi:hypothetical protein